jgi:hypothetical protein
MKQRLHGCSVVRFPIIPFDHADPLGNETEPEPEHPVLQHILIQLFVFFVQDRRLFADDPDCL